MSVSVFRLGRVGLLLATVSFASAARAETLADAIAYAVQINPGLQSQRAALRALDESYVQARAGYAPNISATAAASSYKDNNVLGANPLGGAGPLGAYTQNEDLSIVQPIYTGGRVSSQVSAAEAQIRAGRESVRRFEQDLVQRATTAYVDVRRDLKLLKINQDTVAVLEKELADTNAKSAQHVVTLTDVAQARARLAQARSQLASAETQLSVTRAEYLAVIGHNPGELAPPPPLEALPATLDQAFDAAEANNPQLLGAQYTEQGSRARTAQAKAQGLPSVTARMDYQHGPFLPYQAAPTNDIRSGSVTLSIPLYSGGQIASGVRQAVEENNRDRLTIEDTRLQVLQSVTTAWEQLSGIRRQLTTLRDEMKADEVAFYGVRQEEKFALRSTIEVLNAELELTTAQQNLVRAEATEYAGRVQLLEATGTLTPNLLAPEAETYDPAENFKRVKNAGFRPFEAPARILDGLGSIPISKPKPANVVEDRPTGEGLPPTPDDEAPIVSILTIQQQRDIKPKDP